MTPESTPAVEVRNASVVYQTADTPVKALSNIDLRIGEGEFVSLIGPSGCGKTTLLRVIADLEQISVRAGAGQRRQPARRPPGARLWLCVPGTGAVPVAHRFGQCDAAAADPGRSAARNRSIALEHLERVGLKGFEASTPGSCRAACSSACPSPARCPSSPKF
jgi:NitT/TauT family transport system ATP-binding protein